MTSPPPAAPEPGPGPGPHPEPGTDPPPPGTAERQRPQRPAPGRARLLAEVTVLATANLLAVFDGLAVTVALPAIQRSLRLGAGQLPWVFTAYTVAFAGLLLLGGRLGDRYGHRRTLTAGLLVFATALAGSAAAPGFAVLLTARAAQGAGAALAVPNAYAITSTLRPARLRTRAFAAVTVAGSAASAGGAVAGGLVTQSLGWRWVFWLTMPVALTAACAAPRLLPATSRRRRERLDAAAALLATAAAGSAVYALTTLARPHPGLPTMAGAFGCSAAAGAAFAVRERRAPRPLLRPGLVRSRSWRTAALAISGQAFASTALAYTALLYFQQIRHMGPLHAGTAYLPLSAAAVLTAPLAGRLLAGGRWPLVATCGQILCAAGLVLLAAGCARDHSYWAFFLPGLVLLGAGISAAAVSLNLAAGQGATPEEKGAAYGAFETVRNTAGALAVATLAAVTAASATAGRPVAGGYRAAFLAATAATALAAAATAAAYRRDLLRGASTGV